MVCYAWFKWVLPRSLKWTLDLLSVELVLHNFLGSLVSGTLSLVLPQVLLWSPVLSAQLIHVDTAASALPHVKAHVSHLLCWTFPVNAETQTSWDLLGIMYMQPRNVWKLTLLGGGMCVQIFGQWELKSNGENLSPRLVNRLFGVEGVQRTSWKMVLWGFLFLFF